MAEGTRVVLHASGHANVRATHGKTFELTSDPSITQAGTCILGVDVRIEGDAMAIRGPVRIDLEAGSAKSRTSGMINPLYLPGDPLIFRKDPLPKSRSFVIGCADGAADLDRTLVEALRAPGATLRVTVIAKPRSEAPRDEKIVARAQGAPVLQREVDAEHEQTPPPRGVLYVVGVPIGNDDDLSARARRVLGAVDVIACEDTRTSRPLLDAIGSNARRLSYHDHNERERAEELRGLLEEGGRIAVISDAGVPGVADPGHRLVQVAHEVGAVVSPIAGPSAALLAVVASGLGTDAFAFGGFLPKSAKARLAALRRFAASSQTTVVYEAPHRAEETLEMIDEVYGDRAIAVARELTKSNEEILRAPAARALAELKYGDRLRGEITLVLPPAEQRAVEDDAPDWLEPMCRELLAGDVPKSTIAAAIRAATGWPKKKGYKYVVDLADR